MGEAAQDMVEEELACPLCEYSLRGLIEPRCPECGYSFEWAVLRASIREKHPYLYEHADGMAPRRFFKTLIRGWTPSVFWKQLQAGHRVDVPRLWRYWAIVGGTVMGLILGFPYIAGIAEWANEGFSGNFTNVLSVVTGRMFRWSSFPAVVVFAGIWPMAMMGLLAIFTDTLTAARIRRDQLWRCAVYCGDVFLLTPVLAVVTAIVMSAGPSQYYYSYRMQSDIAAFASLFLLGGIAAYRLWIAFRIYLRMPQATAIVLLTQLIAALAAITTVVAIDPARFSWMFQMF